MSEAEVSPIPAYAMAPRPKRVKRIRLALFLTSLAAALIVSIGGFLMSVMGRLAFGLEPGLISPANSDRYSLMGGFWFGVELATASIFIFFITVPATWLALGLTVGRFPHRGITARRPYVQWTAVWGAALVGGTTLIAGYFLLGVPAAAGALVAGVLIGTAAGAICGALLHAIIRPARQVDQADVNVF